MNSTALQNMIDTQLRPGKITDERVISAFTQVPRENFVPIEYQAIAYTEINLPIGKGQMLLPQQQAYVLQALAIQPRECILEIGTGCGYFTALLAQLGKVVWSVDDDIESSAQARHNLASLVVNNVSLIVSDVLSSWEKITEHGPFDVIVSNSAFYDLPHFLLNGLTPTGRLFAIIGKAPTMSASIFERHASRGWTELSLFETTVSYTPKLAQPSTFIF